MPNPTSTNIPDDTDILKTLYAQLCTSYHQVDDFRAKLLGFLPLASGAAIVGLLNTEHKGAVTPYLLEIGLFGALITLGLLIYELKGIQKCTGFIYYGALIEEQLLQGFTPPMKGQFIGLSQEERGRHFFTEPVASAVVYATVMAAWVYVASVHGQEVDDKTVYSGIWWLALMVWLAVLAGVIVFWTLCANPKAKPQRKKQPKTAAP